MSSSLKPLSPIGHFPKRTLPTYSMSIEQDFLSENNSFYSLSNPYSFPDEPVVNPTTINVNVVVEIRFAQQGATEPSSNVDLKPMSPIILPSSVSHPANSAEKVNIIGGSLLHPETTSLSQQQHVDHPRTSQDELKKFMESIQEETDTLVESLLDPKTTSLNQQQHADHPQTSKSTLNESLMTSAQQKSKARVKSLLNQEATRSNKQQQQPIDRPRTSKNTLNQLLITSIQQKLEKDVQSLLEQKANPNTTINGVSVLELALDGGEVKLVKTLLQHKAIVKPSMILNHENGRVLAHRAHIKLLDECGLEKKVTRILEEAIRSFKPTSSTSKTEKILSVLTDESMFDYLEKLREDQIINLLNNHTFNINATNETGQTPLHIACGKGYCKLIIFFLDKGADPHALSKSGRTPLAYAIQANPSTVETLINHNTHINRVSNFLSDCCKCFHTIPNYNFRIQSTVKKLLELNASIKLVPGSIFIQLDVISKYPIPSDTIIYKLVNSGVNKDHIAEILHQQFEKIPLEDQKKVLEIYTNAQDRMDIPTNDVHKSQKK